MLVDMIAESIEEENAGILEEDFKYLVTGWTGEDLAQQIRRRPHLAQQAITELMAQGFLFACFESGSSLECLRYAANSLSYLRFEETEVVFGGEAYATG